MSGTLRFDIRPGDSVRIGDICVMTLEDKSGKNARIAFNADADVIIERVRKPEPKKPDAPNPLMGILGSRVL